MLRITIPSKEYWDAKKEEFVQIKAQTLQLEHSLVSVSKWESKWEKPFIADAKNDNKTPEEILDYVRCMTLTQNVSPEVYLGIDSKTIEEIKAYIDAPMTATTFSEVNRSRGSREIITAEIIYYWMITLNIPFECQKWHLNRLLALIKVCSIKNTPPKKMSQSEILSRNRALNAARLKKYNTKG